ncbi:MAG TPA: hypothetical protein PLK80_08045 [bacterium]|mgnify:CR=1 FL=1|nr:MAG: hypothetical protein BWY28_02788 [bacterium ADurb.Bin236]HOY61622.1 hypothetical protein [bacterium]HPI76674.1 hypothetical protein [bacterium]
MMKRTVEEGKICYEAGGEAFELRPPTVRSRMAAMAVFAKYPDVMAGPGEKRDPQAESARALEFAMDLAAAALLERGQTAKEQDVAALREKLMDAIDEEDLEVIAADFFDMLNRGGGSAEEEKAKSEEKLSA